MQKQYYRAIYEHNVDFLASGTNHSPTLMNVVMELRKCCNHPYLVDGAEQVCPPPPASVGLLPLPPSLV